MEAELAKIAETYKKDVEEIKNMIGMENLTYFQKDVQITKVIDMLYDNAKIKEVEPKKIDPAEIKDDEESDEAGDEKTEEK